MADLEDRNKPDLLWTWKHSTAFVFACVILLICVYSLVWYDQKNKKDEEDMKWTEPEKLFGEKRYPVAIAGGMLWAILSLFAHMFIGAF